MNADPEQIASDWIALQRFKNPNAAPEDVFERGFALNLLAQDAPSLAWEAIMAVVDRYSEDDLFTAAETEAKRILGMTGAGPLEDLLAYHGNVFIETVEAKAGRDRRMYWALGCVWQNSMTDEVWTRVQRAAGEISR